MPSKNSQQHTDQARRNLDFLSSFYNGEVHNDWAVTVSFYSALHVLEMAIEENGKITSQDKKRFDNESHHQWRARMVEGFFPEIEDHYKHLYKQSRSSRYYFYHPQKLAVEFDIKVHLKKILDWSNGNHKTTFALLGKTPAPTS